VVGGDQKYNNMQQHNNNNKKITRPLFTDGRFFCLQFAGPYFSDTLQKNNPKQAR